jgi:hypothetical protein
MVQTSEVWGWHARNEGKQSPVGAGEQKERGASDQHRAQVRIVPCMPKAGANGAAETFHGKRRGPFCGGFHHISAPIIPRLLMALSQNGAAMPHVHTMMPANAEPTARLTLTPTLLAATAGWRSRLGTS